MRRYFAEAFATFALVFAGTAAITVDDVSGGAVTHVGVALTFGLVVTAMIYAVGDVSGAHLNPAVTFGFWAAGRLPRRDVAPYVVSQTAGALAASALVRLMFPAHPSIGTTEPAGPWTQAFVLETVLTALLMFVILSVSSGAKEKGVMAGVAVGAVITFEALLGGPISGASMNPARSLAPALVCGCLSDVWIYVAAPLCGSAASVLACRCTQPAPCCRRSISEECGCPTP